MSEKARRAGEFDKELADAQRALDEAMTRWAEAGQARSCWFARSIDTVPALSIGTICYRDHVIFRYTYRPLKPNGVAPLKRVIVLKSVPALWKSG